MCVCVSVPVCMHVCVETHASPRVLFLTVCLFQCCDGRPGHIPQVPQGVEEEKQTQRKNRPVWSLM